MVGSRAHYCKSSYIDCQDYQDIGHTTSTVYQVTPVGMHSELSVFCDFDEEGEGWIVSIVLTPPLNGLFCTQ